MKATTSRRRWGAIGWSTMLVTSLMFAVPAGSSAAGLMCDGKAVTIKGTPGDDVLKGTPGADVIHGLAGNDIIRGLGGGDTLCGGNGDDELFGGNQGDSLFGGAGSDLLDGQRGNDILDGGGGADTLFGGPGADDLFGRVGTDNLSGGPGADDLFGNRHNDTIIGGPGSDSANGGAGFDRCDSNTVASCEADAIDFQFERFLINQAVPAADSAQPAAKRIDTVAARPGIIRVFISANQAGIDSPPVHLWVQERNGSVTRHRLAGPAKVPVNPTMGNLNSTFNYEFDETFLKPGMKMYVMVDWADRTFEIDEGNNRYPDTGFTNIKAKTVPVYKVLLVPSQGQAVSPALAEALTAKAYQVHPMARVDVKIRGGNYTCQGCVGPPSPNNWITLLNEMASLQQNPAKNPQDRMVHAILPVTWGQQTGIGGIGFLGYPAAVSIPDEETFAHETGHNFNLYHVLCSGQEGNPDTNYPYAGGIIGKWGYNIATGETYHPTQNVDLMTYCTPEWVSDYSFQKAMDHRRLTGYDVVGSGFAAAGTGTVVQFTGTVGVDGAALASYEAIPNDKRLDVAIPTEIESVERVDHPAVAPDPGDYTLVGRDDAGEMVMAVSFQAYAYDHAAGARFMFSVEVAETSLARVAHWDVERAGAVVTSRPAG